MRLVVYLLALLSALAAALPAAAQNAAAPSGLAAGGPEAVSVLMTGNVGVGTGAPDNGTQVPVFDVNASTVAIFGCNSADLSSQYPDTNFLGIMPGTNTTAQDAGAVAYTDTMVRNGTVDQAAGAAQGAMEKTTGQVNKLPENQGKDKQYAQPHVCTVGGGGITTCQ